MRVNSFITIGEVDMSYPRVLSGEQDDKVDFIIWRLMLKDEYSIGDEVITFQESLPCKSLICLQLDEDEQIILFECKDIKKYKYKINL